MVCGKSNQNISFNQFYILGYFQLFTTMFKLLVILFIIKMHARNNIGMLFFIFGMSCSHYMRVQMFFFNLVSLKYSFDSWYFLINLRLKWVVINLDLVPAGLLFFTNHTKPSPRESREWKTEPFLWCYSHFLYPMSKLTAAA